MRLLRLALLLMAGRCAGLALSHWDLEGANGTCDGRASCLGAALDGGGGAAAAVAVGQASWRERNCMCDAACARFGDCCLDSAHFMAAEQRRAAASVRCVALRRFGGVYMVAQCPPHGADPDARARCEQPDLSAGSSFAAEDPLAAMPVTSLVTNVTYRSAACAACHGELGASARMWRPRVECAGLPSGGAAAAGTAAAAARALHWDPHRRAWGVRMPKGRPTNCTGDEGACADAEAEGAWRACAVDPVPPAGAPPARRCEPALVRTCARDWTRADVRARCDAYTALVYEGVTAYRNPHCAVCNRVPLQYLTCSKTLQRSLIHTEFTPGAFAMLLDVRGAGDEVGRVSACGSGELWDPFFKRCRRVLCPAGEFDGERCLAAAPRALDEDGDEDNETEDGDGEPSPPAANQADEPSVPVERPLHDMESLDAPRNNVSEAAAAAAAAAAAFATCAKWVLEPGEFVVEADNASAWVAAYGRAGRLQAGAFRLRPDGGLELCAAPFAQRFTPKFPAALGWVSLAALGASALCLALHLAAFALAPALRSPAGRALASLAAALLLAYASFAAGLLLQPGTTACAAAAALAYFGFLAAAAWSAAVALDVWHSLRLAARELRVRGGSGRRRFVCASLAAWAGAAAAVGVALWADAAPPGALADELRPRFGAHVCWFGHRRALLVFFAAPLAVTTALGATCFAASARVLAAATAAAGSTPGTTGGGAPRRDFRLYLRLALVMGLAWASGLAAAALDLPLLWYAFVALCALQGVFLLWAFTLSGRGRRALLAALPTSVRMRLRKSPLGSPGHGGGLHGSLGGGYAGGSRRPASFSWASPGGAGAGAGLPAALATSASSPSASPASLSASLTASISGSHSAKTQLSHCADLY